MRVINKLSKVLSQSKWIEQLIIDAVIIMLSSDEHNLLCGYEEA